MRQSRTFFMMRRAFLILVLFLVAAPAFAVYWPTFGPRSLRLSVGQTASIGVSWYFTGFGFFPPQPEYTMTTGDPRIALGGKALTAGRPADIPILGVSPGVTYLFREVNGRPYGDSYAEIRVVCEPEPPIQAAEPVQHALAGQSVTLTAVSPIVQRSTLTWYLGTVGDTSRPLPGASATRTVSPLAGVHDYWVLATTPCSATSAAFRVEVAPAKRRAVR
jgi:hypothetical protein